MVLNFIPEKAIINFSQKTHTVQFLITEKPKCARADPCCRDTNKRLISLGAGCEQRPWTPTERKGKIGAETASPGPACVMLPKLIGEQGKNSRIRAAPKFILGVKHLCKDESIGPGPARYNVAGLGVKGKVDLPEFANIRSRPNPRSTFQTPGPGRYDIKMADKFVMKTPPDYKIGRRPHADKTYNTPAPNVYRIAGVLGGSKEGTIKSAPAFSIIGRQKFRPPASHFYPGPGSYDANFKFVMKEYPKYWMGIKHKHLSDKAQKPGPGAHCPEKITITRRSVPAPSFSIRHSRYAGTWKAHLIPPHLEKSVVQCIPN